MGIFTRIKTGLALTKDSLLLIRHNPKLMAFPLVGGATGLAFLGLFLGITFGVFGLETEGPQLVLLFFTYTGLTFISSLFAAGLVHETREAFAGREPSFRAGMAAAWERKGPIFVWSVIAATVSVIINYLEQSDSIVGRIFAVIFSVAWTVMTFFIIPVIVFEQPSTTEMFKQSGRTFKETWGETFISLIGVQLVPLLVVIPAVLLGIALVLSQLVLAGILVILAGALLGFLLAQTLQGVVKTALYFYAKDGTKPSEFDNVDFDKLATDRSSGSSTRRRTSRGGFR